LSVASQPAFLIPGFFFVIAAGFAREYDGEDLSAEPYHLAIPIVASTAACFILTILIWLFDFTLRYLQNKPSKRVSLPGLFVCLLNFYWMTAPLALLYGIPFERFSSELAAVENNLLLLALVALWRVTLMIRCVSVLFRCSLIPSGIVVLFFSCMVAWIATQLAPFPVLNFMGGFRISEAENTLAFTIFAVTVCSFLGMCVFGILYLITPFAGKLMKWEQPKKVLEDESPSKPSPYVVCTSVAVLSILIWIPLLDGPQQEQRNRRLFSKAVSNDDFASAIQLLEGKTIDDFPPYWGPPPRYSYNELKPKIETAIFKLIVGDAPDWIVDLYLRKLSRSPWYVDFNLQALYGKVTSEQIKVFIDKLKQREKKGYKDTKLIANFYTERRNKKFPLIRPIEGDSEGAIEAKQKRKLIRQLIDYSGKEHEEYHNPPTGRLFELYFKKNPAW